MNTSFQDEREREDANPYPFPGAFWSACEMALDEKRKGKPYDPGRFKRVPATYFNGDLHDAYRQAHEQPLNHMNYEPKSR